MIARIQPKTAIDLMQTLAGEGLQNEILCVQMFKKFEWCVTFSSSEICDNIEEYYAEDKNRHFLARRLRENSQGKCTLEGVPFEFSNMNIKAQLEQYLDQVEIEMDEYKNLPEGMGTVYTGNRIVKYTKIKKPPPNRIKLGKGVSGWINDLRHEEMESYVVKCRKCLMVGHISESCSNPAKCTKCGDEGHSNEECGEDDCSECHSKFHTTDRCLRKTSARQRGWQGPSFVERVKNVVPEKRFPATEDQNWMLKMGNNSNEKDQMDEEKEDSI